MTTTTTRYTVRRFRVRGEPPEPEGAEFLKALHEHRFQPLGKGDGEEESAGWITAQHIYDTDFTAEKLLWGRYVRFALRMDRRRVPPKVLAAEVEVELAAWREANDRAQVPYTRRREIRQQVKDRLMASWPPQSASYEITWNPRTQRLYFHGTSDAAAEELARRFRRTFALELEWLHPFALAHLQCEDVQSENRLLHAEEDVWCLLE
ncbi:MAG: recombination-associated protein RdgC [Planctomycetes bacterium]|nr:recombination-associated protein RdgC [Planctomycetota bacterium]